MRLAERLPTLVACLCVACLCVAHLCLVSGCARSAVEAVTESNDASATADPSDAGGNLDGGDSPAKDAGRDAGTNTQKDGGASKPDSGGTLPDAAITQCNDLSLTCDKASSLGEIDAATSTSKLTREGKGSGWYSVDVKDIDANSESNARIGVRVVLTAPAGSTYSVTLMGDTSPDGAGRCVAAGVTDTNPLSKTAVWGSLGPFLAAKPRLMAVHVQHLSGPCDANWTLTVSGNPCPAATGVGQTSLGSCP